MFSEEYLSELPNDPVLAAHKMCDYFFNEDEGIDRDNENDFYDDYIHAYAAIEAYMLSSGLDMTSLELGIVRTDNINAIRRFYQNVYSQLDKIVVNQSLTAARNKYQSRFGVGFFYQFSDGDLARIQELINELRHLLTDSEEFDANHKERLLKRLEALQSELRKKMSSLDKLWGLVGDAGIALGKFGREAKPLVERIREIAQITWRTQARSEELPSGTPLPLLKEVSDE